jgi:hypothetical protein
VEDVLRRYPALLGQYDRWEKFHLEINFKTINFVVLKFKQKRIQKRSLKF